jgi:hypothetical protein
MWEDFQVDSMHAYGDYDESCCLLMRQVSDRKFLSFLSMEEKKSALYLTTWMLGMGVLYVQKHLPDVSTLFITHATSIGRSIAGNK